LNGVLVDTSAWYALLDPADPDHRPVATQLERHRGRLVTSSYIFDEALTLARYRLGMHVAQSFGEALRSGRLARQVRATASDEEAAWEVFLRYCGHPLSFTDCTELRAHATAASRDRRDARGRFP
jgi:predicted nucleic acid-binding protein